MTAYRVLRRTDNRPVRASGGKLYGTAEPPVVSTVYPKGFAKRLVGTASRLLIPATTAGFPLLMRAKHPDLRLAPTGFVRTGKDFRVESLSGTNYPFHVHNYDGATGLVELVAYAPLTAGAVNQLALYFDQVGINGEDLKGSWNSKALAVYHLPSMSDFSGNARHLRLNDTLPVVTVPWRAGFNLAVAEFGQDAGDIYDTHYTMPTTQEVDYYAGKGAKLLRVPFLFRRIVQTFDMNKLLALIDRAALTNTFILLDPHEYGMINGVPVSNSGARTAFANYWITVANAVKAKANIVFGLMNEPMNISVTGGITAANWLTAANQAIAAIRSTGATQLILVPGTDWTGAHSWMNNNSSVMAGVVDPNNNYAYEMHQYLDSDFSGTNRDAVTGAGATVLVNATNWARSLNRQIVLGEFGYAVPEGNVEAEALMDYMDANRDVWAGWTYWAGGPWWGEYMFTIEPLSLTSGPDRPQMAHVQPHLAA